MSVKYDLSLIPNLDKFRRLEVIGVDWGEGVNTSTDPEPKPEPKFKVGDAVRVIVSPEDEVMGEWLSRKPGLKDLFRMTAGIIIEVDQTEGPFGPFYQYAIGFGVEHPALSDCGQRLSPYSGIWMREDGLMPARLEDVLSESKQVFVIGSL